jgi:hypothetical protein
MIKTLKTFIDSMAGKTFTKTVVQNSSESNYLNAFFSYVFSGSIILLYITIVWVNQAILRIERSSGLLYYYKITI